MRPDMLWLHPVASAVRPFICRAPWRNGSANEWSPPVPRCSEAAIRAKIEERRRLEREKKKFAVRLEGSLAVERPPKVRSAGVGWQMCGGNV